MWGIPQSLPRKKLRYPFISKTMDSTQPIQDSQIDPSIPTMPLGPTPRRTRSQVAPDWTTPELFILVKAISAVENDCLRAVSSYQKWKVVVQSCTTQEVCRSSNQCRGKWNSLVREYHMINQWDAKSTIGSYWELGKEKRKDVGLPLEFDAELFRLVDSHVRAQKAEMETDSDSDPDAEADFLHAVAKLGFKKKKRKPVPLKIYDYESPQMYYTEENHQIALPNEELHDVLVEESPHIGHEIENLEDTCHIVCEVENPVVIHANEIQEILVEQEPIHAEEEPQVSHMEETPHEINTEEKPQKVSEEEKPIDSQPRKKMPRMNKKEKQMAESLRQNADLIHAIVNSTLPGLTTLSMEDLTNVDDFQTFIVRRQADKLIECLGDIVKTVEQFPSLVKEGV